MIKRNPALNTIRRLERLEKFLGRPLRETSNIIRMIALLENTPPEWLKGCSKYADLPRVKIKNHPHVVEYGTIPQGEIARRCQWIVENLNGPWHVSETGFRFADDHDALHFRMRWC